jgi:peptide/nickel transport system permease protein
MANTEPAGESSQSQDIREDSPTSNSSEGLGVPGDFQPGVGLTKADMRAERDMLTGRAAVAARLMAGLTPSELAWRKVKKNKLAVVSLIVLIAMYTAAIFAQFLAPYDYRQQDPLAAYRPPMKLHFTPRPTLYAESFHFDEYHDFVYTEDRSHPIPIYFGVHGTPYKFWDLVPTNIHLFGAANGQRVYILGTDQFGRDYLSRLLYASQISLSVGIIGITLTLLLGTLVGGISGYYGGIIDDVIMRICEVFMSVPSFYILLALAAALPSTLNPVVVYVMIIVILSIIGFAGMARVIRGMVLAVREREYVEAARALGVSNFKIIVRHIVPSTYTFAIVTATLAIPGYILAEAGLSFLGLGIRDPMASWGNMLSSAQDLSSLEERLWLLIPGLMIFIATLAFNFLGDGLRDALDPKSK